jgi:condensin complex subunit 1
MKSRFPIPNTLHDLERSPYNLLPYPVEFNDMDEASRADSFEELLNKLDEGNKLLASGGILLFGDQDTDDGFNEWNDDERLQALYTLVRYATTYFKHVPNLPSHLIIQSVTPPCLRKSSSLAPHTRAKLFSSIVSALKTLCFILLRTSNDKCGSERDNVPSSHEERDLGILPAINPDGLVNVTQSFRDAFSCHIYMLYNAMFIMESDLKADKIMSSVPSLKDKPAKKNSGRMRRAIDQPDSAEYIDLIRDESIEAMLFVSQTMSKCRYTLWPRGVPEESVICLPLRVSFLILESGSTSQFRKSSLMKNTLNTIATSLSSDDRLFNTALVVLVDLLHSYEHAAALIAELCCLIQDRPVNKLAIELLREVGRIDTSNLSPVETEGKASGIKNVAPFIYELAERKPQVMLMNINLVLSHLDSDPYYFRSAIVSAIGLVLINSSKDDHDLDEDGNEMTEFVDSEACSKKEKLIEIKEKLFSILLERARDVNSFVRAAVLKSFALIIEKQSLPIRQLIPVTALSIDRVQDRTVIVRRHAMQVS